MTLKQALKLIEFPEATDMSMRDNVRAALERWKALTVEARRAGDEKRSAQLSQAHEVFKKAARVVCECGGRKHPGSPRCPACKLARPAIHVLHDGPEFMEIPPVEWPSVIRDRLRMLEHVGQCLLIRVKSRKQIYEHGKALKLGIEIRRAAPGEYRVWRTDGKTMEEVNSLVRARQETNGANGMGRARA